jgi:hypothetical protein
MAGGEHTQVECAKIVSDEEIRTWNGSADEEALQFVGNVDATARLVGRVAPAKTGAIVGTDTGKSTDLRLNKLPNKGGVIRTCLHDDGGTPDTRAVDVKP